MSLSDMKMGEVIRKVLDNPSMCPCLFIGKYVTEFKKLYSGRIFHVGSLEAVREVVGRFSGISDLEGKIFVMDGVGFLSSTGQNSLLKFIEESKFPIVILSYYDKVSPIIKSRVKFIFKKSTSEIKNFKFVGLKEALNYVEEKKKADPDYNDMDEIGFYADNCPIAFVWKYSIPQNDFSSKRMLKILSKL